MNILLITPLKPNRDLKNSIQLAALHFNKEITVEIGMVIPPHMKRKTII